MNFESPADLSPLSYGTGLALGLALLIGLPAAPAPAVALNTQAAPPPTLPLREGIAFR